eukprot:5946657-Amphidinium_carterae.1
MTQYIQISRERKQDKRRLSHIDKKSDKMIVTKADCDASSGFTSQLSCWLTVEFLAARPREGRRPVPPVEEDEEEEEEDLALKSKYRQGQHKTTLHPKIGNNEQLEI